MLFDPPPDLASDFEWMLQSGQASDEMLLEVLMQEYHQPVYRLALSILDDEQAARHAVQGAFAAVLVNRQDYRPQIGARQWLYAIVLEDCQRVRGRLQVRQAFKAMLPLRDKADDIGFSTPENELDAELWLKVDQLIELSRLALLLHAVHAWQIADIGRLLQLPGNQVQEGLEKVRGRLLKALSDRGVWESLSLHPPGAGEFEALLSRSLQKRWPLSEFSEEELAQIQKDIARLASRKRVRQRALSYTKEIAFTTTAILAIAAIFWGMNHFFPESPDKPRSVPTVMVTQLVYREVTPTADAADDALEAAGTPLGPVPLPEDSIYVIQSGDTLSSIARLLDSPLEELSRLNRISSDAILFPGQRLLIPQHFSLQPLSKATPVPAGMQLNPLEEPYSTESILSRIVQQPYHTLWIDAWLFDYGPRGYIGPPQAHRLQAWIGESQHLILVGALPTIPDEVWLRQGSNLYMAKTSENRLWFAEWQAGNWENSSMYPVHEFIFRSLFDSRGFAQGYSLRGISRGSVAGREALIVEQRDTDGDLVSRFWLDDRTGLVLRKTLFKKGEEDLPRQEVVLGSVAYDVDFHQELFDSRLPWRGGFANDQSGSPLSAEGTALRPPFKRSILVGANPPADFDPASANLIFQYAGVARGFDAIPIDVVADGYRLGQVRFGIPWTMICQRSPDGKRIAFVSHPSRQPSWSSALHWFSLTEDPQRGLIPLVNLTPLNGVAVTQFAFSPDSQKIAIFGYTQPRKMGNLYVVDTASGETRELMSLADAKSLVWSPDGKYLAMIVRYQLDSFIEDVVVLDQESAILYSQGVDLESGSSSDWPMTDWGVEFPVEMGDLEACVLPPR